ncbi:MAG: peptidase U32 family protein [Oligoflexus sp.]
MVNKQHKLQESTEKSALLTEKIPEILAPAGGRAQFFAALHAGADAVYLGLKEFNARGRAENFDFDDLRELLPLARQCGMRVLITLNILIKELELGRLIDDLAQLQWLGVEAVIIQDLSVARIIRRFFPSLRIHASTQMAIHNVQGVKAAAALGFRRVVVARELTAQELRLIRRETMDAGVEIEAFCHGSLCYSYSGLCFFSGAEDARSGNRGECAYTCRKPYRVLNEPGHGFLFSMKDLDTSKDLEKLVAAGIDTLKIEGRKKDAQYVATAVGLYRQELNRIFGRNTAPQGRSIQRDFRDDMAYSFHRETTSFFVKGRYHENVIDLANPTHKGKKIGKVTRVQGRSIEIQATAPMERFDGLRIDRTGPAFHAKPQHGERLQGSVSIAAQKRYENEVCQFSLREFSISGRKTSHCRPGEKLSIQLASNLPLPKVGDEVFKVRSNELKRSTEAISQVPQEMRLRPAYPIKIAVQLKLHAEELVIQIEVSCQNTPLHSQVWALPAIVAKQSSSLKQDLTNQLSIFGEVGFQAQVEVTGEDQFFVPRKQIKAIKQELAEILPEALLTATKNSRLAALDGMAQGKSPLAPQTQACFQVKVDRLASITAIDQFASRHQDMLINELIFEPKRAFLTQKPAAEILAEIREVCQRHSWQLRLAIPTVLRAWDLAQLKPWILAFQAMGGRHYEIGNLGAWQLLQDMGLDLSALDIASDFSLYALNSEALAEYVDLGISKSALSIEDDADNIQNKLRRWPSLALKPQVILYKDTPLFIAEACSLTALHNGCPTAKVCGYRTLEIANDAGERFFVAHESCKSIVYGADAFAITQDQKRLLEWGVQDFRLDFLTREYTAEALFAVLEAAKKSQRLAGTYPGNFERQLL